MVALAAIVVLALVGIAPENGTHAWHSIQVALNSVVNNVEIHEHGTHAWH